MENNFQELNPEDVFRFFEQNPTRRYFAKLLGGSDEREGFISILIITKGPRMGDTAMVVDWRPGAGEGAFAEVERWLNTGSDSEAWIEKLLAGADDTVRKYADIRGRGELALMPAPETRH